MPTNNDEIIEKYYTNIVVSRAIRVDNGDADKALNEARSNTTSKHIGAIWNWWATKPQKSKNDATTRIITRADIEELVRMME